MYGWDKFVLLKHLLEQKLSRTAVADQAGVSRGLIYHVLRTVQLDRDPAAPRANRAWRAFQPASEGTQFEALRRRPRETNVLAWALR